MWTGREVFNLLEDAAIEERAAEIQRTTGRIYIAALNSARSELWKALSNEDRDKWEEKADQWTLEGPDPDLRAACIRFHLVAKIVIEPDHCIGLPKSVWQIGYSPSFSGYTTNVKALESSNSVS